MTPLKIADFIASTLCEQLGIEIDEIDHSKTWEDHGANSLDKIEIVMAIEEDFDISIQDEDAERLAEMPINEGILWIETQLAQ